LEEVRGKEETCLPGSTPFDGERETTSFKFIGRGKLKTFVASLSEYCQQYSWF